MPWVRTSQVASVPRAPSKASIHGPSQPAAESLTVVYLLPAFSWYLFFWLFFSPLRDPSLLSPRKAWPTTPRFSECQASLHFQTDGRNSTQKPGCPRSQVASRASRLASCILYLAYCILHLVSGFWARRGGRLSSM